MVACGLSPRSLGFYSRFAVERYCYSSPYQDSRQFTKEIAQIAASSGAQMVIPAVESTLVALDRYRHLLDGICVLASPPSATLECVIDKWKTVNLARQLGVPVPKTFFADSPEQLDLIAETLPYPVALKPRGNRLHVRTEHKLGFKVKYAGDRNQLRAITATLPAHGGAMLAQEFVPGTGVCVAAVADQGNPLVLFPYVRTREWPITGGISVVRESINLDDRLRSHCETLLRTLCWHGVAMIEFKRVHSSGDYVLMEINGRFQASTALSLDAGLNLPAMVYGLYSGEDFSSGKTVTGISGYRPGVRERWLQGDWYSLLDFLFGRTHRNALRVVRNSLPAKPQVLFSFLRDFFSAACYDEYKTWDMKPGVVQALSLVRQTPSYLRGIAGEMYHNWQRQRAAMHPPRVPELAPGLGAVLHTRLGVREEKVPETSGAGNRT